MTLASPYRMPEPRSTDDAPRRGAEILTPDGRSLPLASARLRVEAGAGLARVVLEQTFENPYDATLRVTYKMPLPVDGAVSGYAFRIGARTITGRVDRKETARARFEEAIVQGRTAALLEQAKADIFTQDIGNIPPRSSIVAEITIDQRLAWTPRGEWELRFPTVIGPRYMAAHVSPEDRRASHVELADGSVRARVHLEIRVADALSEGRGVESPSHVLHARGDGAIELLDAAGARLDRDVVVRWAVAKRDVGLAIQVARPAAAAPNGRNAYALLSIVPPAADAGHAAVPRDLIVLLDTSGSMDGPPLEQGKRVVAALIDSLAEHDRLEVIEFSSRPNRYARAPVHGTRREKDNAIHWVMARKASGGTEMQSAIIDALRGLRAGAQRQVVLVTDGYVGGEEQIITLMHESLPQSCRMHVVGVGSAANRALAAALARAGRGAEVLVGLDEDAEKSARTLLDRTRAPVLTDLVIGGDALVDCSPEHLPDVFAGAPVLAAMQVRAGGGEIVVRGNLARGSWEQRIQVPATAPGEGNGAVAKLYGRERVADLEMRWSIGNEVQAIDREIESIGVVFQIATRRTSWIAVDDDRSVDPKRGSRHEEIPQELPYGTTMASFGGPYSGGSVAPGAVPSLAVMPAMAMARSAAMVLPRPMAMPMAMGRPPAPAPGMGAPASPPPPPEGEDEDESLATRDDAATLPPPPQAPLGSASWTTSAGVVKPALPTGAPAASHAPAAAPAPAASRAPAEEASRQAPRERGIAWKPRAAPATSAHPRKRSRRARIAMIAALVFLVLVLAATLARLLLR